MDEQNGGGQPGFWEAWTESTSQSGPTGPAEPKGAAEGQPADVGYQAATGATPPEPPAAPDQSAAFTQPGFGQPPGGYGYQAGGGQGPPPGGYGGSGGHGGGYGMPPGYGGPPRRRRGLATVITYLAVAALAATAGGLVVSFADSGSSQPGASTGAGSGNNGGGFNFPNNNGGGSGNGPGNGSPASISSATVQKVKNAVLPGVVVINSSLQFDGNGAAAAGTGMIISKSGLVLTNNHVINGTTGLTATVVATGHRYPAKWLGYDKTSDIAVIQIEDAPGLSTVPIGDSSTVKLGDDVIGMGNAGGTGSIQAVPGTITGLDQSITASDEGSGAAPERLTNMLQTNADIVSGDSGGPLASTAGKVIGMDTAASTNSFANQQNVGFAIPMNRALTIAHQIIAGQSGSGVQIGASGFVGVLVAGESEGGQSTETSPQAQLQQQEQADQQTGGGQFGNGTPQTGCVPNGSNPGVPASIAPVSSGTLVLGTICGAPAAQAGMVPGDVITSVAGKRVSSPASLTGILQGVHGGSAVPITWVTPSDQTMSRTLTVGTAPPE
ncbi:MAG: S1C family serine protease [Streptosporangiaceae bacterium]